MSRRPDYLGVNTIIHPKITDIHFDCGYRSHDGKCMNKYSQSFGKMCKRVRNCTDYCQLKKKKRHEKGNSIGSTQNQHSQKKSKKTHGVKTIRKIVCEKTADIGDFVFVHSCKHHRVIRVYISERPGSRSPIANWAIGKSVDSEGMQKKNLLRIVQIVKQNNNESK